MEKKINIFPQFISPFVCMISFTYIPLGFDVHFFPSCLHALLVSPVFIYYYLFALL